MVDVAEIFLLQFDMGGINTRSHGDTAVVTKLFPCLGMVEGERFANLWHLFGERECPGTIEGVRLLMGSRQLSANISKVAQ